MCRFLNERNAACTVMTPETLKSFAEQAGTQAKERQKGKKPRRKKKT
jgi:hypothetical protein